MTDSSALSIELTALATAVDGVTNVYPATVAVAANEVVAHLGRLVSHDTAPQLVSIEETSAGMVVRVRIAVAESASARDVSAKVYDAIAAHLIVPIASIEVRVGSIG